MAIQTQPVAQDIVHVAKSIIITTEHCTPIDNPKQANECLLLKQGKHTIYLTQNGSRSNYLTNKSLYIWWVITRKMLLAANFYPLSQAKHTIGYVRVRKLTYSAKSSTHFVVGPSKLVLCLVIHASPRGMLLIAYSSTLLLQTYSM